MKLVAVSKTQPVDAILPLYQAGQRIFGENRVQELVPKQHALPKDIEWHLIGHLQTNKVKYIAPFISYIHSVDSFRLLKEINKQATLNNRIINCLLQIHVAQEETKFGLDKEELTEFFQALNIEPLTHIRICGIMGMASLTDNKEQVKTEFAELKRIFDDTKQRHFAFNTHFKELSMGMSGDYELAIAAGSTMVRIGSLLFKNDF